ncbi:uncharacterized protein BO87DRAFT_185722 [Aspergillus neoniger CBS 115656]|uniref:Secreted protein n=1 Tax=Aspergillus neoniger (strain CBS 115656) TaxID=1448310 RepID=A0A318YTN1_ASPNB|nr:hypothetical protein BO87DRAFT_185722 [Aspergillus neoniger CBS 115656]PYH37759.1 hypothetical protein BO87DRAFT_185722 [Aspergillus neoniger CBS 115656]
MLSGLRFWFPLQCSLCIGYAFPGQMSFLREQPNQSDFGCSEHNVGRKCDSNNRNNISNKNSLNSSGIHRIHRKCAL